MSEILLTEISKSFQGKRILNKINLSIEEGEMISLLGPSGCGKTTTLKIIAGLIDAEEGDILFNGRSILNIPVEKRGAVIVFQDCLLFPHLTIEENIGFGLKMAKVNKIYRKEKVKEMLKLMELEGQEKKYPSELSGGQKQRVALARALAIEPKVLLLDEPFSNLDLRLRESMRELICKIQKELKITTILVTHDKEEALMTSDKIAVMFGGEIKQFGKPKEIYENPISEEVANFFGETNYLVGRIEKECFISSIGRFKTKARDFVSVKALIRPEKIEIFPLDQSTEIQGEIIHKSYAGDRIYYKVLVKGIELKCSRASREDFNINENVFLKIDSSSMMFYEK